MRVSQRLRAFVLVMVLALTACTGSDPTKPGLDIPPADDSLSALVSALSALDLSTAPLTTSTVAAQNELDIIVSGMDDIHPVVAPGAITYLDKQPQATAELRFSWPMPSGNWEYTTKVALTYDGPTWLATWAPGIIAGDLNETNRLVHTHITAKRGSIIGNNGVALVEEYSVVKIGIDKTRIDSSQWSTSARALATATGIDVDKFVATVAAAGPRAFVVAITLRQDAVPSSVADIPGAIGVLDKAMLTPTTGFAEGLLGTMGEASPELVEKSKGAVQPGDLVGVTGLQARYDEQLRGTPGDKITVVARRTPSGSPSPSPTATPSAASGSPSASASASNLVLYDKAPVAGTPLKLSLDLDWQTKAQNVMATVPGAAAAAVIQTSSGGILAMASSPGSEGQPDANFGRWAPGSTFKIATSLAMIRNGYTPDTLLNCTATADVEGWKFKNYSDFPSSKVGRIPLKDAVAQSCNTAFINDYTTVSGDDLKAAAASLGVGVDYDAGFPVFYGEVPQPDTNALKAQEFIGQGGVLASPVAMAGLAASVGSGRTTIPWLVESVKPQSTAAPLTAAEAQALQTLMAYTVQTGSGQVLQGFANGAKTGTAEYGSTPPLPTHAWMICYTGNDLAIAVWVKDGESGSGVAGPLIKQLLS